MENRDDILDDLLTRLGNEELPRIDDEEDFIDSIMAKIPERKPAAKPRGWVIALRASLSMAAAMMIGLFVYLNGDTGHEETLSTQRNTMSVSDLRLPCVDNNSTPEQVYACYVKQQRERDERYRKYVKLLNL